MKTIDAIMFVVTLVLSVVFYCIAFSSNDLATSLLTGVLGLVSLLLARGYLDDVWPTKKDYKKYP